MGRKTYCSFCGETFKSKILKKEHKLKFPDGSCVEPETTEIKPESPSWSEEIKIEETEPNAYG
jgi:hypothetical protein